jgi:hypothetical protein
MFQIQFWQDKYIQYGRIWSYFIFITSEVLCIITEWSVLWPVELHSCKIELLRVYLQHINEEEDKEGYNVKMDKKSLIRLLVKLSKDGHVKVIKIVLKGGTKEKILSFVCEPDITTGKF